MRITLKDSKKTAAGLDQWKPVELKMLSDGGLDKLAQMLSMIEKGAAWSSKMNASRVVLLSKDEENTLCPSNFRVHLMLPATQRLWSRTKLRRLQPWVNQWATPETYAGVEAQGVDDAAYHTALVAELRKLTHTKFSGGAADIYKCLDQIVRPLIYKLLEEASMPDRILETCKKFLEALVVHKTIGGGLGGAYTKPTSIPQGDPMSMMVTSLLLRPWVEQMKCVAAEPKKARKHFHASDLTHAHLHVMGARLAAQKSISFSSEPAA